MATYLGHEIYEIADLARVGGTVAGLADLPLQWVSPHLRNGIRSWVSRQSPSLLMRLVEDFPHWARINAEGLNAVAVEDTAGARPLFLFYTGVANLLAPNDVLVGNIIEPTGACCGVAVQVDLYLKFVPYDLFSY